MRWPFRGTAWAGPCRTSEPAAPEAPWTIASSSSPSAWRSSS
jgi:hypothetical protein